MMISNLSNLFMKSDVFSRCCILINCSNLKIGGGIQVAHSFINKLSEFNEYFFVVVVSDSLKFELEDFAVPTNVKFINYNVIASPLNAILGINYFLDNVVKEENIIAVFSVFGPTYWRPKVSHLVGYAIPHYVYKDSPFFANISMYYRFKLKIMEFFHLFDFKYNNSSIVTENEDVTKRLKNILVNKEIHTVSNYYHQIFDDPSHWDRTLKIPKFSGFTLLTISANYPHKNLLIIKKVVRQLKEIYPDFRVRFILTVNESEYLNASDTDIKENILCIGKININQCPALYELCDIVFLPTLLECFTAAFPEAMRMRKPLMTSYLNFAIALSGDAALYFNPLNVKEIAEQIYQIVYDDDLKVRLVETGTKQLRTFDNYTIRAKKYIQLVSKSINY